MTGSTGADHDFRLIAQGITEMLERQRAEIAERFRPVSEIQAELDERFEKFRKPLLDVAARVQELIDAAMPPPELRERLAWIEREEARAEAIEATGWLAHASSPFHLVDADGIGVKGLGQAVADYYRDEWDVVAAGMRTRVNACLIDDEAKYTFDEALTAHGIGLFRCAPRLLFPEIERVARVELHGGELAGIASLKELREAIGGLTPMQMEWSGVSGLRFYRKLTEHIYQNLRNPDAIGIAATDPVPNRHAAVHGLVTYAAANTSFNAIASAEYLLLAVSAINQEMCEPGSSSDDNRA